MAETITVEFTREEALRLGIIHCECGHPPNNHFGSGPCAHCDCKELRERVSCGRQVAPPSTPETPEEAWARRKQAAVKARYALLSKGVAHASWPTDLDQFVAGAEYEAAHREVDEADQLRAELAHWKRYMGDGADGETIQHLWDAQRERDALAERARALEVERDEARASLAEASRMWDGPETTDWLEAVSREAAHQVARWGKAHDDAKSPEDFFWLLGYLAGKALASARAGDIEKAMHHTISSGAALLNWHARLRGDASMFQPGSGEAAHQGKDVSDG